MIGILLISALAIHNATEQTAKIERCDVHNDSD